MNPERSASPARILVVEDQDDVRRLLVTALELEGHEVDEAGSAADGLRRLLLSHYHLVLTDYAMPGGTGAWMLHQATQRGLMQRSVALVITAYSDVPGISNVEILTKPLDLDEFLAQVRRLLAIEHPERRARPRLAERPDRPPDAKVELVLYVSSASPASMQAVDNLERILERFNASEVEVTIHDLAREPLAAEEDGIGFTPTLVKRYPEPRMWVLGNLRDPETLEDLLRLCGVGARRRDAAS